MRWRPRVRRPGRRGKTLWWTQRPAPRTANSSINITVDCYDSFIDTNFDRTNDSSLVTSIDVEVNNTYS
jgi:hypothetical protein